MFPTVYSTVVLVSSFSFVVTTLKPQASPSTRTSLISGGARADLALRKEQFVPLGVAKTLGGSIDLTTLRGWVEDEEEGLSEPAVEVDVLGAETK